jgi:hypothetical protein
MITGRPLLFSSNEQLRNEIELYFQSCWKTLYTKEGMPVISVETGENEQIQFKPYTVAGLASYLKTSRQTLINYESKEEFFDTIMEAKERIQAYQEERLFDRDGVNGAKFSLINNYKTDNYQDAKAIDHTTKGGSFNQREATTEELIARAEASRVVEDAS